MNTNRLLLLLVVLLNTCNVFAQSVEQAGIAYRYNGKKQRTPISGVYVKVATSPNGDVSREHSGRFVLKLKGIGMGDRMGYATVTKKGMMVFNKEEVDRWSVRKGPLTLVICDANEFQKQKEKWTNEGKAKAERKYKKKLADLEKQNKELQLSIDKYYAQLDSIEKEHKRSLEHMDEYADRFARIDESEIDSTAQKAMDLFNQGLFDEAIRLLENEDYCGKIGKALQNRADAEKRRKKAEEDEILANRDLAKYIQSARTLVDAYKLNAEWEKAGALLKSLADSLNTLEAISEYAYFALSQNLYGEAEMYHKTYINRITVLYQANPQAYEPGLAMSYNNLASLYNDTRRFDDSETMHKAALEIRERLAQANPQAYEPDLAQSYNNLASLYNKTRRFDDSETMHKAAVEIYKRLAQTNPQAYEPDLAASYNNLASLYNDTRRFDDSETMHKAALEIRERLAQANPQAYEPDLAQSYNNLAILYNNTQHFDDSETMHKAALEIRERLAQANPQAYEPDLAASYNNLAILYNDTQHFDDSETMHKAAVEIYKRLAQANPQAYEPDLAMSYYNLAFSRGLQEKYTEAINPLEQALNFYEKSAEKWIFLDYYTSSLSVLHQLYSTEKKYSLAYNTFKRNIHLLKAIYQSDREKYTELLSGILTNQSFYSLFEKQYAEAEGYAKGALQIDPTKHLAYTNLAAAYLMQGKYEEAEMIYRRYKAEFKDDFLKDFEELEKARVIPSNRTADVEKIKKILNEE